MINIRETLYYPNNDCLDRPLIILKAFSPFMEILDFFKIQCFMNFLYDEIHERNVAECYF